MISHIYHPWHVCSPWVVHTKAVVVYGVLPQRLLDHYSVWKTYEDGLRPSWGDHMIPLSQNNPRLRVHSYIIIIVLDRGSSLKGFLSHYCYCTVHALLCRFYGVVHVLRARMHPQEAPTRIFPNPPLPLCPLWAHREHWWPFGSFGKSRNTARDCREGRIPASSLLLVCTMGKRGNHVSIIK